MYARSGALGYRQISRLNPVKRFVSREASRIRPSCKHILRAVQKGVLFRQRNQRHDVYRRNILVLHELNGYTGQLYEQRKGVVKCRWRDEQCSDLLG